MLDKLFKKYNCDKSTLQHNYVKEYEAHLLSLREKEINILEIGIWKGTSLEAFHDYLPNAQIYGVDIFTRVSEKDVPVLKRDRVHWMKADSTQENLTKKIIQHFGDIKFDVIIDDGLHTPEANLKTFNNFFPLLKEDGVYYVEDAWPIDILTTKEMENKWLKDRPEKYNMFKFMPFLSEIKKHNVTRLDFRKMSNQDDSYIFKIEKK
jgi:23S rRNA U2552 (ribose-2'-O)-methylase RlmE/FtsJ